jgi:hypothetical protein
MVATSDRRETVRNRRRRTVSNQDGEEREKGRHLTRKTLECSTATGKKRWRRKL